MIAEAIVSILVLLDDAYRQEGPGLIIGKVIEFQSLFFWMMPTGQCEHHPLLCLHQVSILVLLDDAYRLIYSRKDRLN